MDIYAHTGIELDLEETRTVVVRRDTWRALEAQAASLGWTPEHLASIILDGHIRPWG